MPKTLNIWKCIDGKQGHVSQSDGLISAIKASHEVAESVIDVRKMPSAFSMLFHWVFRKRPTMLPSNVPDLIIGAGHRTHSTLLLAKSLCGGRSVVLMKPSLPLKRFDYVIVPKHDVLQPRVNVIETQGALNAVPFVHDKDLRKGLMLIGGESKHYEWEDERVAQQVKEIVEQDASVSWTLTTSRRTPDSFLQFLEGVPLAIVPFEETDATWLLNQYEVSGKVWVTPDSVSMVYESLSSGAVTNIFSLSPSAATSRVRAGLEKLVENKTVCSFDDWDQNPKQEQTPVAFNESARVANILLADIA